MDIPTRHPCMFHEAAGYSNPAVHHRSVADLAKATFTSLRQGDQYRLHILNLLLRSLEPQIAKAFSEAKLKRLSLLARNAGQGSENSCS
jgi:hypothetical protein